MFLDFVVLACTITGLFKLRAPESSLWNLIFRDSILYCAAAFTANAIATVFALLGLNPIMDVIFAAPACVLSAVVACRSFARVAKFNEKKQQPRDQLQSCNLPPPLGQPDHPRKLQWSPPSELSSYRLATSQEAHTILPGTTASDGITSAGGPGPRSYVVRAPAGSVPGITLLRPSSSFTSGGFATFPSVPPPAVPSNKTPSAFFGRLRSMGSNSFLVPPRVETRSRTLAVDRGLSTIVFAPMCDSTLGLDSNGSISFLELGSKKRKEEEEEDDEDY